MTSDSKSAPQVSIVLPAKNEAPKLAQLLNNIRHVMAEAEIILVDDGSTDDTAAIAAEHGATVIQHPYSMGNGAAIKTGARQARGDIILFMDADGQHEPTDIPQLIAKYNEGYDMVVGARQSDTHASLIRRIGNTVYNKLASWMTGYPILDLTSGFRAVNAQQFRKYLYLLPNKFSYPTTITMAFFRSGLPVAYVPVRASEREGVSHIKLIKDGFKFFIIILKIGALFSPMRFFLPISAALFLTGLAYYGYTYFSWGRLTNMGAILFLSSLKIFLIGIISEQISSLHYKNIQ